MNTAEVDHPELANGLTNHKPMVVSALRELGASPQQLRRYQQRAETIIAPVTEPATDISDDTVLHGWLGRNLNYGGLYRYFNRQTQRLGIAATVNRYLPGLADGLTSRAFHPLIRLGHALHDQNTEEVAAALAYWTWAYQPLPFPAGDFPADRASHEVLPALLSNIDWPDHSIDAGPRISDDFLAVTQLPAYQQLHFRLASERLDQQQLKRIAIQAYWMHDDFTLLHGVTGSLAVERVSAVLEKPAVLLEPFWKGLVISWLSTGLRWQEVEWPTKAPSLSVTELRQGATQSSNDHTIKLVAACLSHYQGSENILYLHAAQRAVEKNA